MLDNSLYEAFGQAQVSTMYTGVNQYHVVLEVAPTYWQSPVNLSDVYIRAAQGKVIPLSAVAHYEPSTAPLSVNHQGQYPSVTISFNLAPGVSLSDASRTVVETEQKIGMPSSIRGMFSGTLQAFQDTWATMLLLIVTALLAVYIVLGILYESYIHPLTIISTLPSAGVGAFLALMIFHKDLSFIAIIGVILLIGIVKKNAILMIDFALAAERSEGKSPRDAIFQACILRFRPIMMTTTAAICGAMPLAFGRGTGSELRNPLGMTIIGGLLLSQMLTLYTTPVVYLSLDRLRVNWLRAHGKLEAQRHIESFG
jgi:multidrug efflux pump subunit AcrB